MSGFCVHLVLLTAALGGRPEDDASGDRPFYVPENPKYTIADSMADSIRFTLEKTLRPDRLEFEMTQVTGDFFREKHGVLTIDCLDVLLGANDFNKVNEFLKTMVDIASVNRGSVIAHLEPRLLKPEQIALLEKRFDRIMRKNDVAVQ